MSRTPVARLSKHALLFCLTVCLTVAVQALPFGAASAHAQEVDAAAIAAAEAGPDAAARLVKVVVVSPGAGSGSARSGSAHLATIRFALAQLGDDVRTPFGDVRIQLLSRDDGGTAQGGRAIGEEAVSLPDAVAVLGPVNSDSTHALLGAFDERDHEMPVLSSLSTARILTDSAAGPRSPNFFRLIFHDADRMRWYASYLATLESPVRHLVLLHDVTKYGEGLRDSLRDFVDARAVSVLDWCELGCAIRTPDASVAPTDAASALVTKADGFVLLGSAESALQIAARIEALRASERVTASYQRFFVGQDPRLLRDAPVDAVTIGDPVLDPSRAPTEKLRREWEDLLTRFTSHSHLPASEFMPTAYEAVLTLRTALERVIAARTTALPDDLGGVRRALRTELETGTFDSLEPWRKIRFSEGDLADRPTAPIYRIRRERGREDAPTQPQWIELAVQQDEVELFTGFAVVVARLKGSRPLEELPAITLHVGDEEVPLEFVDGRAEARIWKLGPGSHRIHTEPIASSPSDLKVSVGFPYSLLPAAALALLGSWLVSGHGATPRSTLRRRLSAAAVAGVVLSVLSSLGPEISSAVPVVSLSPIPPVNAALIGFVSGVAGPGLLLGLLHRVSALFGGQATAPGDAPAKPEPAAAAPPADTAWRRKTPGGPKLEWQAPGPQA